MWPLGNTFIGEQAQEFFIRQPFSYNETVSGKNQYDSG
jgi:hypothetical protein